jgi:penicillin-binding protein 1A
LIARSPPLRIVNRRTRGRPWRLAVVLLGWLVLAAPQAALIAVVVILRDFAADLPSVPDLDEWERTVGRTSVLVAADGTLLAEIPFHAGADGGGIGAGGGGIGADGGGIGAGDAAPSGHRQPVAYADLPPLLVAAILAAEDVRFFAHRGVDVRAVVRAAWANYRAGRVVEGASTITQQVARNLLPAELGAERSARRKIREALLARRIERRYSKQRIFEVYANYVFLGANAYGVAAAARAYFSKSLDELDVAEAALIAGLIQAPGRTDPYRNPEAARERRDLILARMERAGFLAADEHARARARPLGLVPPPLAYGALAAWHTERARREVAASFAEDLARGGLRIETTAQPLLGVAAEASARRHADELGRRQRTPPPQVGALIWDHRTGYVEATVGGLSWAEHKFDRATQACRQPGSAFKPIVYAAALELGVITPGTPIRDAPIAEYDAELDVHWKPTNAGRRFRGVALAHDALVASLNAPAIEVLDRVGARRVIEVAHRLGLSTPMVAVRPLALGSSCVIPIELAGAFAAIARGGRAAPAVFVTRVRRGDRVLLDRAAPDDPTLAPGRRLDRLAARVGEGGTDGGRVLDAATAYQMSAMLVDVVARGTGQGAHVLGRPVAGKTGTTNDNTDAWFVGYTDRVVGTVWLGHDDPAVALGPRVDGARAALPLWADLVAAAEADRPPGALPGEPPAGLVGARIDRETGLLAQPGAGGAVFLYFKRGTEPTETAGRAHAVSPDVGRLGSGF